MSILTHQKKIILAVVTVFLFSVLGTTAVQATESQGNQSAVQDPTILQDPDVQEALPDLMTSEEALSAIENIPESVVNQGSEAILDWFKNNIEDPALLAEINAAIEKSDKPFHTEGVWGCISSVGVALVTLAWAPAKLLKIKKALKALGGVGTFVRKSISYFNYYKKKYRSKSTAWKKAISKAAKKASPDIQKALLGFFGVTAIYDACTS
ncbi:hypothetical protein P4U97_01320 [Bacillus swezeyi]|uniref:hypothetical protein n=1 Tax=Bacillus swezeyi TaxID=1925020 RepID=UPI002E1F49EA|nr:hypothetical protein [Bacillus swezeyi]